MTVIFVPLILLAVLLIVMVALMGHHFVVLIAHIFHPHILGALAVIAALIFMALLGLALVHPSVHVAANSAVQINSPPAVQQWTGDAASASGPEPQGLVWRKLLLFALLAGLIIAFVVVPLARGRIHLRGHLIGGGIALAVIGVVFLLLFFARSQSVWVPQMPAHMVTDEISLPPGYRADAASHNKTEKRSASDKKSDAKDAKTAGPAELPEAPVEDKSPETNPEIGLAAESRPAWAKAQSHQQGDSYFAIVPSGIYEDPLMREQMLDTKMVLEANHYIDEMLYHRSGVSNVVDIDADYLRKNCLRKKYPDDNDSDGGNQSYAQLEFDNHFKSEVDRRYRQFMSLDRVQQLGGFAIAGFAVLGGIYVFLRLTPKRPSGAA